MMVKFTDAQLRAIETKGSDILVSAAAGSGKTAVLVERIKRNIIDGSYSIDEVFVSTFTNKSAKDMKDKIEQSLRETYLETKDSRLNEEIIKLNDAHISTLHSFCLHLIQTHYNVIGLPPDMRTLGQVEAELNLERTISHVLETFYLEKNQDFLALDQLVSSMKDNAGLHKLITELYYTAIATEDPLGFLAEIKDQYINEDKLQEILEAYQKIVYRQLKKLDEDLGQLKKEYDALDQGEDVNEKSVIDAYDRLDIMTKSVINALDEFKRTGAFTLVDESLVNGRNKFLKQAKDMGSDILERYNKPANDRYQKLKELKQYSFDDVKDELSPLNGMNNQLLKIVEMVIESYKKTKRLNSEMDFNDYEHYALEILEANQGEVAATYREKFKEVMIDEYQDINRVQEAIIQLLKSGDESDGNLFMVGDVKQSIYRFRQAAPDLFIDKSERFNGEETGTLIQLNRNFRSKQEVLDVTNLIFENIMDKEIGEIDYTDKEKLIKGIDSDDQASKVEVSSIIYDQTANAKEADIVEIKEIIKIVQSIHNKGVPYSDIVILNRNRFAPDDMRLEFQKNEIPISVDINKGYFETFEITTMRSILSILDNPLQDDHLMGVLRLPMFGFTEEILAKVRAASKESYLYEALVNYSDDEIICMKIADFLSTYDDLKEQAKYLSVSELISEIFFELNIMEFFSGLAGGTSRKANLLGLVERALEFEAMNSSSLYQFVSYIDFLIKEEKDFGEEAAIQAADDAVRVMTIHSSKGLEFKHVIYADLKQNYNLDTVSRVLVHPKLGLVFKQFNADLNAINDSIHAFIANDYIRIEQLSEELRLIYVALTRAEEKLYLPLMFKKEISLAYDFKNHDKPSFESRLEFKSSLDFLAPILLESGHPAIEVIDVVEYSDTSEAYKKKISLDDIDQVNLDINPEIEDRLFYHYPNKEDTEVPAKESVTSIKRRHETPPSDATVIRHKSEATLREPELLSDSIEAPLFGTIMHEMMMRIMEQWDNLSLMNEDSKESFISDLIDSYSSRYEHLNDVQVDKIKNNAKMFFNDQYMLSLLDSQDGIYTELPFIMSQEAIGYASHEKQLVQGIIDCLLVFEDHYTIVDYKTDRVSGTDLTKDDLLDRYWTQMDIYKKSAEAVLGKPVDAVLYFFDYGAISVETF